MTSNTDDETGYGKPPKEHQFKKGKSGNAKGRPRGSKSFRSLVLEGMSRPVLVSKNGAQKSMPYRRALANKLLKDAFDGDRHARAELIKYEDQGRVELERQQGTAQKKVADARGLLANEELEYLTFDQLGLTLLLCQIREAIRDNMVELRRLRAIEIRAKDG